MAFQDMTFGDWVLMVICFAIATALLACWSRSIAGGWPWTPDDVQPESFSEELRERLERSAAANDLVDEIGQMRRLAGALNQLADALESDAK